ncbi:hypothetical protein ACJJI3_07400 [Microbulbifer sp. ZKSA004]|uniref:hypothetical protein n=1 Tax=unclassified Microbulbifer TaxID=2619833 RepID=UPI0040391900
MIPEDVADRLESALSMLAYHWRSSASDYECKEELEQQYVELLLFLMKSGWEGFLEPDSQLPSDIMPEQYYIHEEKYG